MKGLGENLPAGPMSMSTLLWKSSQFDAFHYAKIESRRKSLHLEVEDHVQFPTIKSDRIQNLLRILHAWHLTHAKGIVLLQDCSNFK